MANLKQDGKIMLYTNLMTSNAEELNDMTIGITFPKGLTPFGKTILEKSENVQELEKRISMQYGKPMRVKYIENMAEIKREEKPQASEFEALAQNMDLPFNIID